MPAGPVRAETAGELQQRLAAEREGQPFLVYRDGAGAQVIRPLPPRRRLTLGRGREVDVDLDFDGEVSRVHAELEPIGSEWALVDDGLSRNGSFVNRERVTARRRLRDGDLIRLGETLILFRDSRPDRPVETAAAGDPRAPELSERQRAILIALCRPFGSPDKITSPATNKEIAAELYVSVDTVKAHLRTLFERFGIDDLPQNQKRVALAELALRSGLVVPRELR
jgi:pSer/pThr/pTyr-binding forkhead associated (FHA) protein